MAHRPFGAGDAKRLLQHSDENLELQALLTVPHDLSVVGFDDLQMASLAMPSLTTVRQPLQGLGRMGVDMLYRLLQGQGLDATRIELSTSLVVRESTAAPPGTSFLT